MGVTVGLTARCPTTACSILQAQLLILRSGLTWTTSWRTLMDMYSTIPGIDPVSQKLANKRGKYVQFYSSDTLSLTEYCFCMLIIAS